MNLQTASSGKSGAQTEETAMGCTKSSAVVDYQKPQIDASFSNVLSELLNSRPIGQQVKKEASKRYYVNQPSSPNAKGKSIYEESMTDDGRVDPHEALYHIIVSGTINLQHSNSSTDSITPPSEHVSESSDQHLYYSPDIFTPPGKYTRIVRRPTQHDYVNVLPHINEEDQQNYEKMECQTPTKPQTNDYVVMANMA